MSAFHPKQTLGRFDRLADLLRPLMQHDRGCAVAANLDQVQFAADVEAERLPPERDEWLLSPQLESG